MLSATSGDDLDLPPAPPVDYVEPSQSLTASAVASPAFQAPVVLNAVSNGLSGSTARNPQSKVWQHGSEWWSIFATGNTTYAYKLSGNTWTPVVQIADRSYYADVKPVDDDATVVYALLFSTTQQQLAKLTWSGGTYRLSPIVNSSTPLATVPLSSDADTATVEIDSRGRMWVASDTLTTIEVRYSDAPYTSWSNPVTLASGMSSAQKEISAVVALPSGHIGVMWSNHVTQRFGFRLHRDGASPTTWSADEVPASQSAVSGVGEGMADDHLNVKVASDGTRFAAVKTGYDNGTDIDTPEMALLVRRPNGQWDPLYGIDGHGTRGIVEISETDGRVVYLYASESPVDDLVYKTFLMSDIDPANPTKFHTQPRQTLLAGGTYKAIAGSKQVYDSELVTIATRSADTSDNAPYAIVGTKLVSIPPPVNQPPVNTVPVAQTILEDTPRAFSAATGNAISISDPDAGAAAMRVTLTITGGTATVGTANITLTGNGTSSVVLTGGVTDLNAALNALVFTPTPHLNGSAAGSIQIVTTDQGNTGTGGAKSDSDTVRINISAVNDPPSFAKGTDRMVQRNASAQSITAWAKSISEGPSNESSQDVTFVVTNNNSSLFSSQPAITAGGRLTFTPARGVVGSATVTVILQDDGGTANGGVNRSLPQTFTIAVVYDTDAPWHNGADAEDVDASGQVSAIDLLYVIEALNTIGGVSLLTAPPNPTRYVDTDGDGHLSGIDLIKVVERLNRSSSLTSLIVEPQEALVPAAIWPIDPAPRVVAGSILTNSAPAEVFIRPTIVRPEIDDVNGFVAVSAQRELNSQMAPTHSDPAVAIDLLIAASYDLELEAFAGSSNALQTHLRCQFLTVKSATRPV